MAIIFKIFLISNTHNLCRTLYNVKIANQAMEIGIKGSQKMRGPPMGSSFVACQNTHLKRDVWGALKGGRH